MKEKESPTEMPLPCYLHNNCILSDNVNGLVTKVLERSLHCSLNVTECSAFKYCNLHSYSMATFCWMVNLLALVLTPGLEMLAAATAGGVVA